MKNLLFIFFVLGAVLLLSGCKCHFKDSSGGLDSYQELALRNDYVHMGYFVWTGWSDQKEMKRMVEQNQHMTAVFRCGFPFYINGMQPSVVNGAVFSGLIDFGETWVNGAAFSPIWTAGCVNGVVIAPLFAGNIIMNGVAAAPINFHGGSFGGVFFGVINLRGVPFDKGGIDGQKELPQAVCHLGVINLDFCFGQYCQIGVFNHSNGLPRFQLGVINSAEKADAGHFALQLGLLNNNGKCILPLVNMTW